MAEAVLRMPAPTAGGGELRGAPARLGIAARSSRAGTSDEHVWRRPTDRDEREGDIFGFEPLAEAEPGRTGDVPKPVSAVGVATTKDEEEEEKGKTPIQTKRAGGSSPPGPGVEARLRRARGNGQPLSPIQRNYFEPRFGFDFSGVSIHSDASADALSRELGARAFTVGHDIYFRRGEFDPAATGGRRLLAHELTHVTQQAEGAVPLRSHRVVAQRQPAPQAKKTYRQYSVLVPSDYKTLEQMYRLFERSVYGKEMNIKWNCNGYCDMTKNAGKVVPFQLEADVVEQTIDPAVKKRREESREAYDQLVGPDKQATTNEANRRYYKSTGSKPGTTIKPGETGKADQWDQALDDVMKDQQSLKELPPAIKDLMTGKAATYKPSDYEQLVRIAEKLKQFSPEDLQAYKLLTIRATDNLDLFEKSVDSSWRERPSWRRRSRPRKPDRPKEPTLAGSPSTRSGRTVDEAASRRCPRASATLSPARRPTS